MFVWWLVKRAVEPVVELWNDDYMPGLNRCLIVVTSFAPTLIVDFILWVLFDDNHDDGIIWFVASGLLMIVWVCFGAYHLSHYIIQMHTEYRAEQPEKPKRKGSGDVSQDESPVYFEHDGVSNWDIMMRELNKDRAKFMKEHNQKAADRSHEFNREMQKLAKRKAEGEKEQARQSFEDGYNTASEYIDELFSQDGE